MNNQEMGMYISGQLRELGEYKNFSQGDIEKRTSLLRCYISRVENGHIVPALETLEKFAWALEVPLYQLFYEDSARSAKKPPLPERKNDWASQGKGHRLFDKMYRAVSRMTQKDRQVLLVMAAQLRSINRSLKLQISKSSLL